jgi:hypothetical protein
MVRKLLLVAAASAVALLLTQCGSGGSSTKCPNGCTDSTGACVSGNSTSACGKPGTTCGACSTGQTCSNNTCVSGSTGGGSGTGGGSSSTGGGSSSTGGGSSSTGGGSSGTGGGSSGTGGGSSGTGGGANQNCNIASMPTCPVGTACMATSTSTLDGQCFPGCDLGLQNCPNAGQKCTYAGSPATRSCVMAGTVAEDGACTQNADMGDNCAAGLICNPNTLKCVKFCIFGDQASCSAGKACESAIQIQGHPEFALVCSASMMVCNLLTQDCMNNQACVTTGSSTLCSAAGTNAVGANCTQTMGCVKGSQCVNTGAATKCVQFCNLDGGMPTCASGTCTGNPASPLPQGAGFCPP